MNASYLLRSGNSRRVARYDRARHEERQHMTGYSTVVFDLDGTLLDTLEDLHLAINHTLAWAGLPEQTLAETRAYVGNGIRRLIENSVPGGTSADIIDTMQAEFDSFYAVHCDDHTHPYPGIPELLESLRAEGRRISVVSNKTDYAVASLVAKHFPDAFDVAVGVREGVAKKPARDMVDLALSLMGEKAARLNTKSISSQTCCRPAWMTVSVRGSRGSVIGRSGILCRR